MQIPQLGFLAQAPAAPALPVPPAAPATRVPVDHGDFGPKPLVPSHFNGTRVVPGSLEGIHRVPLTAENQQALWSQPWIGTDHTPGLGSAEYLLNGGPDNFAELGSSSRNAPPGGGLTPAKPNSPPTPTPPGPTPAKSGGVRPQLGDAALAFFLGPVRLARVKAADDEVTGSVDRLSPSIGGPTKPLGDLPTLLRFSYDRAGRPSTPQAVDIPPGGVKHTPIDPIVRAQLHHAKDYESPPGFIDRNWPYLLGGAGLAGAGYLAYNHMNKKEEKDPAKRADTAYDAGQSLGRGANQWLQDPANMSRAEMAAAQAAGGIGLALPAAMMLRGGYSAAAAPKGYFLQSGLRGAGIGAGAALGSTAAGVGHALLGNEQDLGTNLALRVGGGVAGGLGASYLLGEHPADADRKKEEALRASGKDEESMRQKFLAELLAGRKQADTPLVPAVGDWAGGAGRWVNDNAINPLNTHFTNVTNQAGTNAGNAARGTLGLGSLGDLTSNPYVLGAGIGALGGAGLSLVGGIGSKRKKKDRLGDAATGGLLGAGAGLLGAGLYSHLAGGAPTPAGPTPATIPPAIAPTGAGGTPQGDTPTGNRGTPLSATELAQGGRQNTPLNGANDVAVDQNAGGVRVRALDEDLGRIPVPFITPGSTSGINQMWRNTGETVRRYNDIVVPTEDAARPLWAAAAGAGNTADANRLSAAWDRYRETPRDIPDGTDPADRESLRTEYRDQGRARFRDVLDTSRQVQRRLSGDGSAATAAALGGPLGVVGPLGQFDRVAPEGGHWLMGAVARARQNQGVLDAQRVGLPLDRAAAILAQNPNANIGVGPGDRTSVFTNPLVRGAVEGTAGMSLLRGGVSGVRALAGTNDPVALRAQEALRRVTGGALPPSATPPGRVSRLWGNPLNPLSGTAPTGHDLTGMGVRELLTDVGLLRNATAAADRLGITVGGRPVDAGHVRSAVGGMVDKPGHLTTSELTQILNHARHGSGGVGGRLAAAGRSLGGALNNARGPAFGMLNPRNMIAGGMLGLSQGAGRLGSPTTPVEDLLGLQPDTTDPFRPIAGSPSGAVVPPPVPVRSFAEFAASNPMYARMPEADVRRLYEKAVRFGTLSGARP